MYPEKESAGQGVGAVTDRTEGGREGGREGRVKASKHSGFSSQHTLLSAPGEASHADHSRSIHKATGSL